MTEATRRYLAELIDESEISDARCSKCKQQARQVLGAGDSRFLLLCPPCKSFWPGAWVN